jgi:hypothetical protein
VIWHESLERLKMSNVKVQFEMGAARLQHEEKEGRCPLRNSMERGEVCAGFWIQIRLHERWCWLFTRKLLINIPEWCTLQGYSVTGK